MGLVAILPRPHVNAFQAFEKIMEQRQEQRPPLPEKITMGGPVE